PSRPRARVREPLPPPGHRARLAAGGILRYRRGILGLLDARRDFRTEHRPLRRGAMPRRLARAARHPRAWRRGAPSRRRAITALGPPQWERAVLEKIALKALDEQRRQRQWNALSRWLWLI